MFSLRTLLTPKWPKELIIPHENGDIMLVLKPSARAKKLSLRVKTSDHSIVLTAPPRAKLSDIESFALRHIGWIIERQSKLKAKILIETNAIIPYRGENLLLLPSEKRGIHLMDNTLLVGGEITGFKRRVIAFLKEEARREITKASHHYAEILGVTIESITMRDTTSRWGSCSSSGALNYSWRIILAPPFVLEYLCAHEVSHRLEMNHSPKYWAHVNRIYPRVKEANLWLKKNGASLFLIE